MSHRLCALSKHRPVHTETHKSGLQTKSVSRRKRQRKQHFSQQRRLPIYSVKRRDSLNDLSITLGRRVRRDGLTSSSTMTSTTIAASDCEFMKNSAAVFSPTHTINHLTLTCKSHLPSNATIASTYTHLTWVSHHLTVLSSAAPYYYTSSDTSTDFWRQPLYWYRAFIWHLFSLIKRLRQRGNCIKSCDCFGQSDGQYLAILSATNSFFVTCSGIRTSSTETWHPSRSDQVNSSKEEQQGRCDVRIPLSEPYASEIYLIYQEVFLPACIPHISLTTVDIFLLLTFFCWWHLL
jgi:hypothetical protein